MTPEVTALAGGILAELITVVLEAIKGRDVDEQELRQLVATALREHTTSWLAEARKDADGRYNEEG